MTKEQVQKHKETIKWFCDNPDKGVWLISPVGGWVLTHKPNWDTRCNYVPNDKYADIRKAFIDGKVIEFYNDLYDTSKPSKTWQPFTVLPTQLLFKLEHLRVKPEEPKFKVGDWVYTEEGYLGKVTSHVSNDFYAISGMNRNAKISRLWTPKEGDIIIGIRKNLPIIIFTYKEYKLQVDNFVEFDKVIPYIGQPLEEMK